MFRAVPPDETLSDAITRLARASVLVVGDAMLDRYVFGSVARISPEAPVPVLAVDREVALPGGAGNLVRNLTALGVAVAFVSVVGDDQAGSELTGLIGSQPNVEPWLLVQSGRRTTVKSRFVARGQQLLRVDQEDTTAVAESLAARMLRIVNDAMAATSVTVLSDYGKGVLANDVAHQVVARARALGRQTVAAPRGPDYDRFGGVDVVVVPLAELESVTGMSVSTDQRIAAAAGWLRRSHGFGAVVVLRGGQGLSVVDQDRALHLPPWTDDIIDGAGATDTAVSAVAAGLAAGLKLSEAASVAGLAIGVAAGQPGMAVARAADLLAVLTPEGRALRKIVDVETATEQAERWRRLGLRIGFIAAAERPDRPRIEAARAACDRLVVGAEADAGEPTPPLTEAAGWPAVDLVCLSAAGGTPDTLRALRPDLVIDSAPAGVADIVRSWGGEVVFG